MKMMVGLHPKLKLFPCNQLAVKGHKINVSVFFSWKTLYFIKHRRNIAPSPSALLLLYLFFAPELQLSSFVSLWLCLYFILWRNVVIMLQGYNEA